MGWQCFRDMNSLKVGPWGETKKDEYDWALKRFLNEAKILSRLSHPNIVPILAAFKALGTAYYVMPHVEGTELQKAAPAPDDITAEWLLPVLEKILSALGYLHAQRIIHRDIKPNNILMNATGEPILIDFGTARTLENTLSHTQIGTPGYMPLEQLSAGGNRGPWTDFYALGATCHRLITGVVPPHSLERIDKDGYIPLAGNASLAGRFPEHVLSSIDKALRIKIDERWQSAQEWLEALTGQLSVRITPIEIDPQTVPAHKTIQPSLTRAQAQEELAHLGITPEKYDKTLLKAAKRGEAHMVTLLLTAGANVNKASRWWSKFPLYIAAANGHTECVRALLAAPGIDVNMATKGNGETPLIIAAANGHTDCVRLLLAAPGIDVNKVDNKGNTPLCVAITKRHTECALTLLSVPGIDVNKENQSGWTPLHWAVHSGNTECVQSLLNKPEIDVNKGNQIGWTPLHWAAYNGHVVCVLLLLAQPGIEVNKESRNGNTPLYLASENKHFECIRILLSAGGKKADWKKNLF